MSSYEEVVLTELFPKALMERNGLVVKTWRTLMQFTSFQRIGTIYKIAERGSRVKRDGERVFMRHIVVERFPGV